MPENWLPTGKDFIQADVLRWTEAVWKERRSKKAKAVKIGTRQITAEVVKEEDGMIHLSVLASVIVEDKTIRTAIPELKKGEILRRKRPTIEKSSPERLPWSDESVRASLLTSPKS